MAVESKIWVDERIASQLLRPAASHVLLVAPEPLEPRRNEIRAGALRFHMVKLGVRRPDDSVPRFANSDTQIHIVEGDGQVFLVKASDLLEDRFSHGQACGCYAGDVLREL